MSSWKSRLSHSLSLSLSLTHRFDCAGCMDRCVHSTAAEHRACACVRACVWKRGTVWESEREGMNKRVWARVCVLESVCQCVHFLFSENFPSMFSRYCVCEPSDTFHNTEEINNFFHPKTRKTLFRWLFCIFRISRRSFFLLIIKHSVSCGQVKQKKCDNFRTKKPVFEKKISSRSIVADIKKNSVLGKKILQN